MRGLSKHQRLKRFGNCLELLLLFLVRPMLLLLGLTLLIFGFLSLFAVLGQIRVLLLHGRIAVMVLARPLLVAIIQVAVLDRWDSQELYLS